MLHKCVIVPLWTRDLRRARIVVMERVAFWSNFALSLAAKYLGFFIGPDSHLHEWSAAISKFHSRLLGLLMVSEGLSATATLHNIQACPAL